MSAESLSRNPEFELRGIDHLALVCRDMKRTIAFYGDVLGMPLVENIELPDGAGHHFIFEIGNGALLTFFWFGNEPEGAPMGARPGGHAQDGTNRRDLSAAESSMCHLAFHVPAEKIDDYLERLQAKGVRATMVNYDQSARRYSDSVSESTIGRSIYFTDPDGVMLEFATQSPRRVFRSSAPDRKSKDLHENAWLDGARP